MDILEIDSVILEFGLKKVLQDVYLKCETGKITGLLGRNGTGKTALMKILYGEMYCNSQSVRINTQILKKHHRSTSEMTYIPQHHFAPKDYIVKDIFKDFNLNYEAFIQQFPDFESCYRSKMGLLSGGQRRIIEVYVVLSSPSKFCLMDEPFSQIMPLHIENIQQLIQKEKARKGILITDHLYRHVLTICDDLYLIKDGKTHLTKNVSDLIHFGYVNSLS